MKTPDYPKPDLQLWASQQLGIPVEASVREARAALLRNLASNHFVPPPSVQESYEFWTRPTPDKVLPSLTEQAFYDEELRLRNLVEEFARGFFQMAPGKRKKRFQALLEQCRWSVALKARLEGLAPGLELERGSWESETPQKQDLVEALCQLFVLTPRERAQRRYQIVRDHARERKGWEIAARHLQKENPELASLEPFLVDEVAWGKTRRVKKPRLPKPVSTVLTTQTADGGSKWPFWVIFFVVISLARIFTLNSSTPPPPKVPPFNPNFPANKIMEDLKKMQEEWKWKQNEINLNDLMQHKPNGPGKVEGKHGSRIFVLPGEGKKEGQVQPKEPNRP
jgi:hypothetical protein